MPQKPLRITQMIWMVFIKNIENRNPNKKRNILVAFDDMIADMLSNEKHMKKQEMNSLLEEEK